MYPPACLVYVPITYSVCVCFANVHCSHEKAFSLLPGERARSAQLDPHALTNRRLFTCAFHLCHSRNLHYSFNEMRWTMFSAWLLLFNHIGREFRSLHSSWSPHKSSSCGLTVKCVKIPEAVNSLLFTLDLFWNKSSSPHCWRETLQKEMA